MTSSCALLPRHSGEANQEGRESILSTLFELSEKNVAMKQVGDGGHSVRIFQLRVRD